MDFDVHRCRRRPDCSRALIYLDTSTFDAIAKRDTAAAGLVESLDRALAEERAICVGSQWHDDELALMDIGPVLNANVRAMRTYTHDLRMRFENELITRELFAAAHEFAGDTEPVVWREAFRDDPDDPPLNDFQADWMNRQNEIEPRPSLAEEVEHDRETSQRLNGAHLELRGEHEWSEIAAANLRQQIRHYLAPLADRAYYQAVGERLTAEAARAMAGGDVGLTPGSPVSIHVRFAEVAHHANAIKDRIPAVAADPEGFCASDAVVFLPTMRLFSFLLAALSADGKRTSPQKGDLHDIWHLTYGLSRCDIVTADKRTCALAHGRNLIPRGARLFEAHHGLDDAAAAIDAL
jgi:hypothetical protein